jgi:hypothetical protein
MSNPTSNFGWQMPTPTDLVTSLPADFEVFGQAVDSSMADLKGGTTGQILSKATNTDMDFVWIANDQGDITGITATSPLTGGGTSGAVTVGIQSASTSQSGAVQLSDSTSTTSSVLAATPTAVKSAYDLANSAKTQTNLLINSNFAINQRGYVSAANLASGAYGFDRWKSNYTNTTLTFTASTQGQSLTINAGGGLQQVIEQGLVPAGTYTLSWTGTATGRVYNSGATPPSYATSPITFTADGTANVITEFTASGGTKTISKVQFNLGTNVAWSLATPTLESELSACQRYYQAPSITPSTLMIYGASSSGGFAGNAYSNFTFPVRMRTTPTLTFYAHDGSAGQVTLYVASTAIKSTSVAAINAQPWGWTDNFNGTGWGTNADSGLLAYGYKAEAEL